MTEEEESLVWQKFKKENCQQSRNQLIENYIPLVKHLAERMFYSLNGKVEKDDLYSTGLLGLMDAVEKYIPSKNIKFSTYSNQRIRGSMLDDIRSKDWVPRTSRMAYQTYSKAFKKLRQELQHTPSDEELMAELQMEEKEYHKLCQEVNIPTMTSIQGMTNDEDEHNDDWIEDKRNLDQNKIKEQRELLEKIINNLPEKKKAALVMYYFEEMTLREISKVLEISEGRVSQILSSLLAQLKVQYKTHSEGLI